MKKIMIIPTIITIGFLAGCEWPSWCECTKTNKKAETQAPVQNHGKSVENLKTDTTTPAQPVKTQPTPTAQAPASIPTPKQTTSSMPIAQELPSPAPMPQAPEATEMPETEPTPEAKTIS